MNNTDTKTSKTNHPNDRIDEGARHLKSHTTRAGVAEPTGGGADRLTPESDQSFFEGNHGRLSIFEGTCSSVVKWDRHPTTHHAVRFDSAGCQCKTDYSMWCHFRKKWNSVQKSLGKRLLFSDMDVTLMKKKRKEKKG